MIELFPLSHIPPKRDITKSGSPIYLSIYIWCLFPRPTPRRWPHRKVSIYSYPCTTFYQSLSTHSWFLHFPGYSCTYSSIIVSACDLISITTPTFFYLNHHPYLLMSDLRSTSPLASSDNTMHYEALLTSLASHSYALTGEYWKGFYSSKQGKEV